MTSSTNLPPTDAYRGAGRPEATYAIERAVDGLAAEMNMDPAEIRRRNFIPPFENGHQTVCMVPFDSGNYEPALDQALELAGYEQLRKEQADRRASGSTKHLGVGLASYVEVCGYAPSRMMAAGRRSKTSEMAFWMRCGSTFSVPNVSTNTETGLRTPMA